MMARRSTKRRPRVVGVIASRADLERAVRMRRPPDLFELRLDRLTGMANEVEKGITETAHAAHHQARTPREVALTNFRLPATAGSARSILESADYIDVELRSARTLRALLAIAKSKKTSGNHFVPRFQIDASARTLAAKAVQARSMAQILFKVATRTDTPIGTRTLLEFMTKQPFGMSHLPSWDANWGDFSVPAGAAGSVLIYDIGRCRDRRGRPNVRWNKSAR